MSYAPEATVPALNSNFNLTISDVIGSKGDDGYYANTPSLYGVVHTIEEHLHGASKVYPNNANAVAIAASATAWNHGADTEVVPINIIKEAFDIHHIIFSDLSANGEYQLDLYAGANGNNTDPICSIATVRNNTQSREGSIPCMSDVIPKNTRIYGRLSSSTGANTASVKILYHEYK